MNKDRVNEIISVLQNPLSDTKKVEQIKAELQIMGQDIFIKYPELRIAL